VLHGAVIECTKRKLKKEVGVRTLLVRGGGGLKEVVGLPAYPQQGVGKSYRQVDGLVGMRHAKKSHKGHGVI
jgi:hypothetical protein